MGPKLCFLCSKRGKPPVGMYKFPKDEPTRKLWLEVSAILKDDDDVSKMKICSRHFITDDFKNPNAEIYGQLLKLKHGAVPSITILKPPTSNSVSTTDQLTVPTTIKQEDEDKKISIEIKCEEPQPADSMNVQPKFKKPRLTELEIAKKTIEKQRRKIRTLHNKNKELQKSLTSTRLAAQALIRENANAILK